MEEQNVFPLNIDVSIRINLSTHFDVENNKIIQSTADQKQHRREIRSCPTQIADVRETRGTAKHLGERHRSRMLFRRSDGKEMHHLCKASELEKSV
jgi:hypothetical protein